MKIYENIKDWLKNYVPINKWIFFNVVNAEKDSIALTSIQSQRVIKTFVDGSREMGVRFGIVLTKNFDTGTSDTNLDAMDAFEDLAQWVEEQNRNCNFPEIATGALVESVEALDSAPAVTVNNDAGVAYLRGQFEIIFMEE